MGLATEGEGRATGEGRASTLVRRARGGAASDGGKGARTDGATATAPYQLCDGSDDVRFAMNQGGGQVESTYPFTNPYGHRFLYITGKCSFVASSGTSYLDGWTAGTLSADQASALTKGLALDAFAGLLYTDPQSCPDAGSTSLATLAGYVDCSCGCDAAAPAAVPAAMSGLEGALATLESVARPLDGPVALVAVVAPQEAKPSNASVLSWPLAWPLSSIAFTEEQSHGFGSGGSAAPTPTIVRDQEAAALRALRVSWLSADRYGRTMLVEQAGQLYWLFPRDTLAPALASAIETFQLAVDPNVPKPLARCGAQTLDNLSFETVVLTGSRSLVVVPRGDSKDRLQLCWDGTFQEEVPVQVILRVERAPDSRTWLGGGSRAITTDLRPIEEAFRGGYPGARLEVALLLPGYKASEPLLLKAD